MLVGTGTDPMFNAIVLATGDRKLETGAWQEPSRRLVRSCEGTDGTWDRGPARRVTRLRLQQTTTQHQPCREGDRFGLEARDYSLKRVERTRR